MSTIGDDLDVKAFRCFLCRGVVGVVVIELDLPWRPNEYSGNGQGIVEGWAFNYTEYITVKEEGI